MRGEDCGFEEGRKRPAYLKRKAQFVVGKKKKKSQNYNKQGSFLEKGREINFWGEPLGKEGAVGCNRVDGGKMLH